MRHRLEMLRNEGASPADVKRALDEEQMGGLKKFVPKSPTELAAYLTVLVALLAVILSLSGGSPDDAPELDSRDLDTITEQVVERLIETQQDP